MIEPKEFYDELHSRGFSMFAGVPDSLLKHLCAYIADHSQNHIITANEGSAVGLAIGHHLAHMQLRGQAQGQHEQAQSAVIYMQNSGLGNAVNVLLSMADRRVYSIPLLLLIGWRGEPGKKDEPQHAAQGAVTLEMLTAMGIPYVVVDRDSVAKDAIAEAQRLVQDGQAPVAMVIKEGTFDQYTSKPKTSQEYPLMRAEAIQLLVDELFQDDPVISTTGKISRELMELRADTEPDQQRNFLCIGSMGHASQVALAVAKARSSQRVYCLDGDGSVIMHMGNLATVGGEAPANFRHIILNNGAHESVGGQPTQGFNIDFPAIAMGCGYKAAWRAESYDQLRACLSEVQMSTGPSLLEIRIRQGSKEGLSRPAKTPVQMKTDFAKFLLP